jgi:PTH1 family peptidyl-tRNA hydrolase
MKIVVGLGNPGLQYENTRHNIGFSVVAHLAKASGEANLIAPAGSEKGRNTAKSGSGRFKAELTEIRLGGAKVLLVRPLTYMNLSGQAVGPLLAFYKLAVADLLVVCDDLSLPLGKLRLRASGSSGGQKGLQDIIRAAGVADVPRLRIGIGETPPGWETADYVLSKFAPAESPSVELAVANAAAAVGVWVTAGIAAAMNQFNRA